MKPIVSVEALLKSGVQESLFDCQGETERHRHLLKAVLTYSAKTVPTAMPSMRSGLKVVPPFKLVKTLAPRNEIRILVKSGRNPGYLC